MYKILFALLLLSAGENSIRISPMGNTQSVETDADDPSVWLHPTNKSRSLIIATDKGDKPKGGLFVFDLQGKLLERFADVDHPNNVDVEYGLVIAGKSTDVVVTTERATRKLRVFAVDPGSRKLRDVTGATDVFTSDSGEARAPMGVGLYKRPSDARIFAIVTPKEGPKTGHVGQYELVANSAGTVDAKLVRRFGNFSGSGECEAVCVDDELGVVYYSDEEFGVRKYAADPDAPNAGEELALILTQKFGGEREGMSIFKTAPGKGYLVVTDQIKGGSRFRVMDRVSLDEVAVLETTADDTDGIDILQAPGLAPKLITMNSKDKNFLFFDWPGSLK